jgi:excisionase family DNA binding protein
LTEARTLPADELPQLCADLELIRVTALARLITPAATLPDSLLTVEQLSARLNVSKDYVYRNKKRFQSFARPQGRKLLFSSTGLDLYLRKSR